MKTNSCRTLAEDGFPEMKETGEGAEDCVIAWAPIPELPEEWLG